MHYTRIQVIYLTFLVCSHKNSGNYASPDSAPYIFSSVFSY
ncbi:hypothetical protein THZB04_10587 [Vibrio owensii]|nr:hypothetical protein THZB04_10587 [Vibrio owensii]